MLILYAQLVIAVMAAKDIERLRRSENYYNDRSMMRLNILNEAIGLMGHSIINPIPGPGLNYNDLAIRALRKLSFLRATPGEWRLFLTMPNNNAVVVEELMRKFWEENGKLLQENIALAKGLERTGGPNFQDSKRIILDQLKVDSVNKLERLKQHYTRELSKLKTSEPGRWDSISENNVIKLTFKKLAEEFEFRRLKIPTGALQIEPVLRYGTMEGPKVRRVVLA
eukprot:NODE_134_length_18141_cov_0.186066.p6 type:complete len:225 gc:universal NODE_134_length_18141_cov_0.186066:17144-17818(+)